VQYVEQLVTITRSIASISSIILKSKRHISFKESLKIIIQFCHVSMLSFLCRLLQSLWHGVFSNSGQSNYSKLIQTVLRAPPGQVTSNSQCLRKWCVVRRSKPSARRMATGDVIQYVTMMINKRSKIELINQCSALFE